MLPGQGWQISYPDSDWSRPVLAWVVRVKADGDFEWATAVDIDESGQVGEVGNLTSESGEELPAIYWHPDGTPGKPRLPARGHHDHDSAIERPKP